MNLIIHLWRAILILHPGVELPLNFYMDTDKQGKAFVVFVNGDEKIVADEVRVFGDSIIIKMPVFDSEIDMKLDSNLVNQITTWRGVFINHARLKDNIIPFVAYDGWNERFMMNGRKAKADFGGKWEVHFSPGTADSSAAIGQFVQKGDKITGTFLTTTGDDRYLEGNVIDSTLNLSCFDGMHLFLFKATMKTDGTIEGDYWSGAHWHEPWIGKRNDKYELPDADTLMHLKNMNLSFSAIYQGISDVPFPNAIGKNKVVILQLMGTWCPNCMDETSFLAPFYDKYKSKGLEIIGLDFEKTTDFDKAQNNVARLKARFNINYLILIAGRALTWEMNSDGDKERKYFPSIICSPNKDSVAKYYPDIGSIYSFPTTIFIDKKGKIRRIHTGYSGPATGVYYDRWIDDFTSFVDKLLKE